MLAVVLSAQGEAVRFFHSACRRFSKYERSTDSDERVSTGPGRGRGRVASFFSAAGETEESSGALFSSAGLIRLNSGLPASGMASPAWNTHAVHQDSKAGYRHFPVHHLLLRFGRLSSPWGSRFKEKVEQWESIWLERIRAYWHEVNEGPFGPGSDLRPPPGFTLGTLGTYQPGTRTLSISREHLETESWANVQHTIRHEMAHQVVAELLDGGDGRPHGPSFQRALDWIENGTGSEEGSSERETPIRRRIARLLALAQSENVHEARRAMETANLLLLRYNLKEVGSGRYIRRRLGDLRMRIPLTWKLVGAVLGEFFFVECVWCHVLEAETGTRKRQLEVLGTEANVEMAEYVHSFRIILWSDWESPGQSGLSGGRDYQAGVILGFQERLRANQEVHREKGLVWVRDPDLETLYGTPPRLHPCARPGWGATRLFAAGKEQGKP